MREKRVHDQSLHHHPVARTLVIKWRKMGHHIMGPLGVVERYQAIEQVTGVRHAGSFEIIFLYKGPETFAVGHSGQGESKGCL